MNTIPNSEPENASPALQHFIVLRDKLDRAEKMRRELGTGRTRNPERREARREASDRIAAVEDEIIKAYLDYEGQNEIGGVKNEIKKHEQRVADTFKHELDDTIGMVTDPDMLPAHAPSKMGMTV